MQENVTLSGTFECLPHRAGFPPTEECAFGFRTDEGIRYALNFGQSATMAEQFQTMGRATLTGFITPIEMLSTDQWQKYDILGIFTVTQNKTQ
jgi:hypothetical protein